MIQTYNTVPVIHPPVHGPVTAATVNRRHVITFHAGLPGFEASRSFVLMESDGNEGLHYLTSVDGPGASFLAIDPRRVDPNYHCALTESDAQRLGVIGDTALLWLALVMVDLDGTVTVNLRAPVVINPTRMVGQQVIPHNCVYPLRHVLVQAE